MSSRIDIHPEAPLVLFAIHPVYVKRILDRSKRWEFRKTRPKPAVKRAAIYSTKPVQKIVALFAIGQVISDTPGNLWELLKKGAGLCKTDFDGYFARASWGYAIEITELATLDPPLLPGKDFVPPQSFYYTSLGTLTGHPPRNEKLTVFFQK
ncbi:MAG: hypothetical protein ACFFD4_02390 [Candidatus Odinarchaeota archaeon]